jgi:hypothetical protein
VDLRERLTRWAHAHPRALVVDAPGQGGLRWEVEAALDERGWELAASPAETDVLIVVGEPAPALTDAIDVLWSQVPRPRNAVVIAETSTLNQQLDAAIDGLVASSDPQLHDPSASDPEARLAAAQRPADEEMDAGHAMGGHDMGGHAGHDMGGRAGHDMGGHDMREHAGHDMSGHDMSGHDMHHGGMVAGLPMAQTARDRDGLDLDTLAVALGPSCRAGRPASSFAPISTATCSATSCCRGSQAVEQGQLLPSRTPRWPRSTTWPASSSSPAGRRRPGRLDWHAQA